MRRDVTVNDAERATFRVFHRVRVVKRAREFGGDEAGESLAQRRVLLLSGLDDGLERVAVHVFEHLNQAATFERLQVHDLADARVMKQRSETGFVSEAAKKSSTLRVTSECRENSLQCDVTLEATSAETRREEDFTHATSTESTG